MDNNWSDAVKRLIGNELLPCPICGMSPDISCEGNFLGHDLYSVGCHHTGSSGDYLPLLITPLSSEFSDCIRMWNNLAEDYFKKSLADLDVALVDANNEYRSTCDIMADIAEKWDSLTSMEQAALATNQQEENLHDSFTEFLRSD